MKKPIFALCTTVIAMSLVACGPRSNENQLPSAATLKKSPSGHTVVTHRSPDGYTMDLPLGWGGMGGFMWRFDDDPFCEVCGDIGPLVTHPSNPEGQFYALYAHGKLGRSVPKKAGFSSWREYLSKTLHSDETAEDCRARVTSPDTSCFSVYDKDGYAYSEWLREHRGDTYEFTFDEKNQLHVDALNSIRFDDEKGTPK